MGTINKYASFSLVDEAGSMVDIKLARHTTLE
jgi:hypothetical protein